MVAAVRRGQPLRAVARQFGVGLATVAYWVQRAKGQRLDRVDWSDRPRAPRTTRRTAAAMEDRVLKARQELAQSDLGASLDCAQGHFGLPSLPIQAHLAAWASENRLVRNPG
jgi:transposase